MKMSMVWILAILLTVCLVACTASDGTGAKRSVTGDPDYPDLAQARLPQKDEKIAVIETNFGTMKILFFPEKAPKAVENFLSLAEKGYYNNTISHRIITDFMMQAGDPTGTGTGGESIWGGKFETELPEGLYHIRGAVAMARTSEMNTNGSQFYIVPGGTSPFDQVKNGTDWELYGYSGNQIDEAVKNYLKNQCGLEEGTERYRLYDDFGGAYWLDGQYTVFGQVFEGLDVLDRIMDAAATSSGTPKTTVRLIKVTVETYAG